MTHAVSTRPAALRGILWMVFAALFFSTIVISARRVAHLPGIEIVFFQSLGTTACMTPWLIRAGLDALKTDRLAVHWMRSAGAAAGMAAMFYALRHMNAADVCALLFTAGLFTVLLATLFLRESLGYRRLIAVVVGFLGALIIIRPGFQEISWASVAMLFVGFSFGAVNVTTRFFAGTENPNSLVLYMYGLMVILAGIPTAVFWEMPSAKDIPWLIILGVVTTLGQQGITRSFATAATAVVMPAYYLQLPFAALLAYVAFGEVPDAWIWVGGAIICAATYYIVRVESAS